MNAINKIARIDALQIAQTKQPMRGHLLYRGVRGVLPSNFFVPDAQGFIAAVEFGFVSTSSDHDKPVSFMSSQSPNVLWVMHCVHGLDTYTGRSHSGANLQPISQYPSEAEKLFPPLCMLQVLKSDAMGEFKMEDKEATNKDGEKVVYKEIHVQPSFV
eukprot:SAG31_NODE_328_length_17643_cov_46.707649_4_plen_158_part_00